MARFLTLLALSGATLMHAQSAAKTTVVVSPQQIATVLRQAMPGAAQETGGGVYDGDHFRIGALKRRLPGEVEVHQKDTDVMYMLSGSATLITGGEVVGAHSVSTDETRGTAIRNGTRHTLVAGDVVVIPKQQPHWFQHLAGQVSYVVIKVQ